MLWLDNEINLLTRLVSICHSQWKLCGKTVQSDNGKWNEQIHVDEMWLELGCGGFQMLLSFSPFDRVSMGSMFNNWFIVENLWLLSTTRL